MSQITNKKHRLPRKVKKVFKQELGHVSAYRLESIAWIFYKHLVIARNYIRAGIPYVKPEWQQWARQGLMEHDYWWKKLNLWI